MAVTTVLVAILIIAVMGLADPFLLKFIIDDALRPGHINLNKLTFYVALMIVISIISGLVGVGQTYLNNLVGQRVMRDLRNNLYLHLQRMSLRFFSDTRTAASRSSRQCCTLPHSSPRQHLCDRFAVILRHKASRERSARLHKRAAGLPSRAFRITSDINFSGN